MSTRSASQAPLAGDPRSYTLIAGYGVSVARALEHSGVDSRRIFAAAGVEPSHGVDPLKRMGHEEVSRLFRTASAAVGDPYFGLTVARYLGASSFHVLGFGLLSSSSLTDFCLRMQRYMRLVSLRARVEVVTSDTTVSLRTVPLLEISREEQDAWLGGVYRLMRELYGEALRPIAVEVRHAEPAPGSRPYVEFFGVPIRFDRDAVTIILPRADAETPLERACPELALVNDTLAANYLAKIERSDVVANVRSRILELLPSGKCSKNRVAADLYLSPTTLQQRLVDRGTSFHVILNDVRRELACGYLKQPGVSVTEITFLLGFTDVSNFTRAFKRWTGTSPTKFRESA
jgi:AraC-like DNA-binding protein